MIRSTAQHEGGLGHCRRLFETGGTAIASIRWLSLTLFFKDTATTRDVNKAQIYAWRKGIKTLYYIRLRQMALEGTEVEGCVSCML